jgi:hypothetical protein
MAKVVVLGAGLKCSFGAAPSKLVVVPPMYTATKKAIATIMDFAPVVNIPPFGMCQSTTNPQVIAATAAALGVLTPMPCVPATAAPWAPGATKVKVGKKAALLDNCKLNCTWAGVIEVTDAGQTKVDGK